MPNNCEWITKNDWRELFLFTVLMTKKHNPDTWLPRDLTGLDSEILKHEMFVELRKEADRSREWLFEHHEYCPKTIKRKRERNLDTNIREM